MPDPLLTIGLPVFNAEAYVVDALCSVLNQTYQNWELLVVDDGSADRSLEIISQFQDERIRVLSDGRNQGLSARLNQTISLARGEFYARMDADDIMVPHRLATQISLLQSDPTCDVVGAAAYVIDDRNRPTGLRFGNLFTELGFLSVLRQGGFIHPTVTGKTAWFRANPYDVTVKRCEDIELWLRTANRSRFRQINEPLLFYREAGDHSGKVEQTSAGYRQMLRSLIETAEPQYRADLRRHLRAAQLRIVLRRVLHRLGGEARIVQARSRSLSEAQQKEALTLMGLALRDPMQDSV
ncbi:hypothetical protein GCM10008955_18650 [Deinococcus malanensis]|uniref:Glycosyltransferase 2-like domain-containing protein n=1 Tax=Deinococcus malanensis TaxID=1706855 RepID=A0ABQ2ETT0_9DEIO|nr:glycosyltransferase [Deinococcus malanensis]GGK25248.1 hypothetical protein GCM10008955_18650 [Deinococcus malanensis]